MACDGLLVRHLPLNAFIGNMACDGLLVREGLKTLQLKCRGDSGAWLGVRS